MFDADKEIPSKNPEPIKYLMAELEVDREHHRAFRLQVPIVTQQMLDLFGWELVYAAYPISGKVNRFVHIWRIPQEDAVLKLMSAGALDGDVDPDKLPPPPVTDHDRFNAAYRQVQSLIRKTRHVLMASLPHDPNFAGIQQLTILVDADGEMFLIDNDDLKKLKPWDGLTKMVECRREKKEKIRAAAWDRNDVDAGKKLTQLAQAVFEREPNTSWKRLQELLDYGATCGELHENGKREVFFNLAELKPHSVYQEVAKQDQAPEVKAKLTRQGDNGKVDPVGDAVIIATPWGKVYRLEQEALDRIARPVPDSQFEGTYRRVKPLVDAGVGIASIPEQRDLIIGDGCQCFVINLQSFLRNCGLKYRPHRAR